MMSTVISVDLPFGDSQKEVVTPTNFDPPKVDPAKCVRCKTADGTQKISGSKRLLCKPCDDWANTH